MLKCGGKWGKTQLLLPSFEKQAGCLKTVHLQDENLGVMGINCGRISFPSVKLLQSDC